MHADDLDPPDPALDDRQHKTAQALTTGQLADIDRVLMTQVHARWRKMAHIISKAMDGLGERRPSLPDVFYAERLRVLARAGRVELAGFPDRMRYCEVRLPSSPSS